jgi:hypothetical protein
MPNTATRVSHKDWQMGLLCELLETPQEKRFWGGDLSTTRIQLEGSLLRFFEPRSKAVLRGPYWTPADIVGFVIARSIFKFDTYRRYMFTVMGYGTRVFPENHATLLIWKELWSAFMLRAHSLLVVLIILATEASTCNHSPFCSSNPPSPPETWKFLYGETSSAYYPVTWRTHIHWQALVRMFAWSEGSEGSGLFE